MTKQQVIQSIETIVADVNAMLNKHEADTTIRFACSTPQSGSSLSEQRDLRLVVEVVEHSPSEPSSRPTIEVIKLFGMPEELAVDYARCRLYGIAATLLGRL